jgi:hypothetical protein
VRADVGTEIVDERGVDAEQHAVATTATARSNVSPRE